MRRLRTSLVILTALAMLVASPAFAAMPTSRVNSVVFVDPTNGYMGGSRTDGHGFISKTTNGGATWQATKLAGTSVFGVDAKSVTAPWAVSYWRGPAWTSTNGGALWSNTAPIPSAHMVWDVAHVVGSTALAVGSGSDTKYGQLATLWRTTNGGASWSTVHAGPKYPDRSDGSTPQTRAQFNAVDAGAGSAAYVVGTEYPVDSAGQGTTIKENLIYKSVDGGATWAKQTYAAKTYPLTDVAAISDSVAFAIGGTQLTSTSNGANWSAPALVKDVTTTVNLTGIDASSATRVAVTGYTGKDKTLKGKLGWSADGGKTWKFWSLPAVSLESVAIIDDTNLVAVGDNGAVVRLNTAGSTPVAKLNAAVNGTITSDKMATLLSIGAPSSPAYRATSSVKGTLTDALGRPLSGKTVTVQYSSNKTSWKKLASFKTSAIGAYAVSAKPSKKTYYRAVYAGDSTYGAKTSSVKTVLPKVYLTRPKPSTTSMRYYKSYTTYSYLKPRHTSGSYPVKIYTYRYKGGKYVYYKSFKAKASNYSSYTKVKAKIKLPYKGKWRIRTVHAKDSRNAKTYSSYRYVTVR